MILTDRVYCLYFTRTQWQQPLEWNCSYGAFTLDLTEMLNENLGGILGGI